MITNGFAGVSTWPPEGCASGLSTVAECGCDSTLGRRSAADDLFATVWRPASPVAVAPSLLSPDAFPINFGRYALLGLLGEGKMGAVYLAHDPQLNRQVALKIPKCDHVPEAAIRFAREASAMAQLRHRHVCPIYDVGEFDGIQFLTMAYLEGMTLAEHLGPVSPRFAVRQTAILVGKLASALDAVHQAGIVHRDMKPANVMIETTGEPIIMDFGLAESAGCARAVKDGLVGTPAYMPPEQVRGDVVGPATDIYSLGVVMYEMLAGRTPFAGALTNVLQQVVSEEPPPPSHFNPGLDRKLEAICLRAMAKSIQHRFTSARELAEALQ